MDPPRTLIGQGKWREGLPKLPHADWPGACRSSGLLFVLPRLSPDSVMAFPAARDLGGRVGIDRGRRKYAERVAENDISFLVCPI
jgi:hypothetical protein